MRKLALSFAVAGSLLVAACGGSDSSSDTTSPAGDAAQSAAECATGKTLEEGVLTIGTGDPAYSPWVLNDKPESKEGFEAAVAYAVATELGFEDASVKWVRTTFDEAIQPGTKNFDFNLQQYSITEERKQTVTFSDGYYTTNQAIVGLNDSPAKGAATLADIKKLKLGAQAGTTSLTYITDVIQPDTEPYVYDDNAGAKAALEAKQIDAAVFDLPTALYVSAVEIEGSAVLGQFPAQDGAVADEFGLVFDKDNALATCVNTALATLKDNGTLASITAQWLSTSTNIPVIK
ncbi:MAG: ABC transporter substrate-binding protein [Acidimicrobiaceae bacterium]|jgi:polar amino acid transport system substrate-binding protein|nr:ABC transporter substrate-binding protein [Ilumatobacteraceae bacterium]